MIYSAAHSTRQPAFLARRRKEAQDGQWLQTSGTTNFQGKQFYPEGSRPPVGLASLGLETQKEQGGAIGRPRPRAIV